MEIGIERPLQRAVIAHKRKCLRTGRALTTGDTVVHLRLIGVEGVPGKPRES
jgi:hypothetical protein